MLPQRFPHMTAHVSAFLTVYYPRLARRLCPSSIVVAAFPRSPGRASGKDEGRTAITYTVQLVQWTRFIKSLFCENQLDALLNASLAKRTSISAMTHQSANEQTPRSAVVTSVGEDGSDDAGDDSGEDGSGTVATGSSSCSCGWATIEANPPNDLEAKGRRREIAALGTISTATGAQESPSLARIEHTTRVLTVRRRGD